MLCGRGRRAASGRWLRVRGLRWRQPRHLTRPRVCTRPRSGVAAWASAGRARTFRCCQTWGCGAGLLAPAMAAEEETAVRGKVLLEDNQCIASMVSNYMSPWTKPTTALGSFSPHVTEFPRKRKGSDSDPSQMEDGEQQVKMKSFREAHSQTEKRRRDKMNTLIEELSAMIPQCKPVARKLDKLTVLRMAVQHLKSLKGMTNFYAGDNYRPSFIQEDELRHLLLKASLTGQSLFDFLHPKDVAKVKEQLSSSDISPREKLIDSKTGLQVQSNFYTGRTRVCSGSRRSFFCRVKSCKISVKEEPECLLNSKKKDHRKFCTIHCTGYLRSWPPDILGMEEETDNKKDSNFTCLIAIGRLHPYTVPQSSGQIKVKPTEFITRFAMNGKFVYVDQRTTAILGYLPQELLGTSCYEYFHQDDHSNLTDKHKAVLQSKEKIFTDSYKFRAKDGSFVTLKSQWFSFTNPWTKELEYIVSVNTLVLGHSETGEASLLPCSSQSLEESSRQSCVSVPGMSAGTVLGAGSIGTDIANEVLDLQRLQSSSSIGDSSPSDLMKDIHAINCRNMSNKELIPLSPSEIKGLEATVQKHSAVAPHSHEPFLGDGALLDFDALCDNDDTAIAAFMNYLEAEGGLGDPGDFSNISWTL
ncbi:PREDICTED: aryl hydrocarbon receptor nuclear translocator-like protein 2 isoform X1 [Hipposideros armiger]|uniref:Aryl hydrocarbon receptor nuclear translocator-like protein 2 isoform X1 n=1 Tax=Hipposideros armiger TaxID=186990 RepID=A0A8B7TIV6_HIPAR|nr:PREDICTED: aryl hydrocarbon receptor nuclear translocator-like protein 2 isoform X1 [Hipposideros armiger]